MNVTAIQDALHAWLSTATGLACLWEKQNGLTQRPTSYVSMDLTTLSGVGGHVHGHDFDASRPAGQEVELRAEQSKQWVLRVQAFLELQPGQTGDGAVSLLASAVTRLRLASTRDTLAAAGVAVVDVGGVTNLTGLAGVRWQGRATVDVRLSVVESVSERVGYIETAEVTTVLTR